MHSSLAYLSMQQVVQIHKRRWRHLCQTHLPQLQQLLAQMASALKVTPV